MEDFKVKFSKLAKVSPQQFIFLQSLIDERYDVAALLYSEADVNFLEEEDYIKSTIPKDSSGEDLSILERRCTFYIPRQKTIDLFTEEKEAFIDYNSGNTENWIDVWRGLFKGKKLKSMGDRNACLKKMNKFLKDNPKIPISVIFDATQSYINDCADANYKYLQQADYFIFKAGPDKITRSNLFIYCEEIINGEDSLEHNQGSTHEIIL